MKKLLLVIATLSSLNADIPSDKFKHLAAGFVIYGGCLIVADLTDIPHPIEHCLVPVIAVGVGKEIYDNHADGHVSELNDILATVAVPAMLSTSFIILRW